jgi:hypothetical protein
MLFQYKGVEAGPPGEPRGEIVRGAEEEVHPEGKVRGVKQSAGAPLGQCPDRAELRVPARRPGDGGNARFDETSEIGDYRLGPSELDGDVGAAEPLRRQRRAVRIGCRVHHRVNRVALRLGHRGDRPAHFAVAYDDDAHRGSRFTTEAQRRRDTQRTTSALPLDSVNLCASVPLW